MKKSSVILVVLFVLLTLSIGIPAYAEGFTGNWSCDLGVWGIQLQLEESEGIITGKHASWSNYGRRLDGSIYNESPTLDGSVSDNVATVTWKSTYSNAQGKAKITLIDTETIHWQITEVLVNKERYIPNDVYLRRVESFEQSPIEPFTSEDFMLRDRTMRKTTFAMNATINNAIKILGTPVKREPFFWEREPSGYTNYWRDVTIIEGRNGIIINLEVKSNNILTARGIGWGAYKHDVERFYGSPARTRIFKGYELWTYYLPNKARLIFAFNSVGFVDFFVYSVLPGI